MNRGDRSYLTFDILFQKQWYWTLVVDEHSRRGVLIQNDVCHPKVLLICQNYSSAKAKHEKTSLWITHPKTAFIPTPPNHREQRSHTLQRVNYLITACPFANFSRSSRGRALIKAWCLHTTRDNRVMILDTESKGSQSNNATSGWIRRWEWVICPRGKVVPPLLSGKPQKKWVIFLKRHSFHSPCTEGRLWLERGAHSRSKMDFFCLLNKISMVEFL